MLRFNSLVTRWLLAAFAVSVLLAWPLHEAQHAAQAMAEHAATAVDLAADTLSKDAPGQDGEQATGNCLWCVFHAQHLTPLSTPLALRFHAEASPPPAGPVCGLPIGRCPLAAEPRGPPQA
jgi:hypothetical protein